MKIIMLHDLDTGGMAAALKPAFIKLGHDCVVMQTIRTYLDNDDNTIDYLMGELKNEEIPLLKEEFKDADLFIIRSISDTTLRLTGVLPYLNRTNTIYRVHGSELREKDIPYSLKTWQIDWYEREPIIVGPRDNSLLHKYRGTVIQHIERPLNISMMPNKNEKRTNKFALHSPTNQARKGTDELVAACNGENNIPVYVISGLPRKELLDIKRKASYFIDHIGSYPHGPYGMNSVEAWYLKIPVWSNYSNMDIVVCPEITKLVHKLDISTLSNELNSYIKDKKALNYAYKYCIDKHNPINIAKQYVSLGYSIIDGYMI